MLSQLIIKNYALIDELDIGFTDKLSTITGETGAGKSIIVGALSLILGERADKKTLAKPDKKCIIEGVFSIKDYDLTTFFDENDLDYAAETILRREISAEGKSRAFINDTPVTLNILKALGSQLVDIHSQHETLLLNSANFQLMAVDSFAQHAERVKSYQAKYAAYKRTERQFKELTQKSKEVQAEADYLQYQFDELDTANLSEHEQQSLEQELHNLSHAEEIKTTLSNCTALLDDSETAVLLQLKEITRLLNAFEQHNNQVFELNKRLNSSFIELEDISQELYNIAEHALLNPQRQEEVQDRLDVIYKLQQKHHCGTIAELINFKENIGEKLNSFAGMDGEIASLNKHLEKEKNELLNLAGQLSAQRKKTIPQIETEVTVLLKEVGMPHAQFKIEQIPIPYDAFNEKGIDQIRFVFSANKGIPLTELSKVASGGELSRFMFCIKGLTAKNIALPTIIFDEIDTGISGEVALKTGKLMQQFAQNMQVIAITHLPQIAGKGNAHFFVYKKTKGSQTSTAIRQLNADERVMEIAKMLSGDNPSLSAIKNAEELL